MKIASVFQDHMVLQRERPIPVWGTAKSGARIDVTLGSGKPLSGQADSEGQWRMMLPPQPAGGPMTMQAREGKTKVEFQDVWVGEVWVASGQSNMAMTVGESANAEEEIAAADYPGIRMLTVGRTAVGKLQDSITQDSVWQVCSPVTVPNFSGVGYFFAREIHRELGVAVGIVNSSWGGTVAEAWTSRQGLQAEPALAGYIDKLDRFLGPSGKPEREAVQKAIDEWNASIPQDPGNKGFEMGWASPDLNDADWETMELPIGWQTAGHDFSGVFWFRREIEVPREWAGRDLILNIGACDKKDHTYFNGEFLGSMGMEDRPDAWCTPRIYTVPGRLVKTGRNVVAVRVYSNIYQGGMVGPATVMRAESVGWVGDERISLTGAWRFKVECNFGKVVAAPPVSMYGDGNPNTPSYLFNGMIAPIAPYAIRGFIWYQGESNADRAAEYRTLFPAMIKDWRRVWGREELPFYFVQLANYMGRNKTPRNTDWAQLREAQRMTLERVPRTGMAVITDIGDRADIHPKNKQDVGRRLAACALALAKDYGLPKHIGSSPLPRTAVADGNTVTIRFDFVGSGLTVRGDRLVSFAIAGCDRVFHWAEAKVVGPDTVQLSSADVPQPCWVRYAWDDDPACPLYGGTGLPASPFEVAVPHGPWLE